MCFLKKLSLEYLHRGFEKNIVKTVKLLTVLTVAKCLKFEIDFIYIHIIIIEDCCEYWLDKYKIKLYSDILLECRNED